MVKSINITNSIICVIIIFIIIKSQGALMPNPTLGLEASTPTPSGAGRVHAHTQVGRGRVFTQTQGGRGCLHTQPQGGRGGVHAQLEDGVDASTPTPKVGWTRPLSPSSWI
jgi:hypothetical protein